MVVVLRISCVLVCCMGVAIGDINAYTEDDTTCELSLKSDVRRAARSQEAIRSVHILSMGREASCFIKDLVEGDDNSHASLFEPLGGIVEGFQIVQASKRKTDQRLQCLYDCHKCHAGLVKPECYEELQEYCKATVDGPEKLPYLVIKTTRIVDHLGLVRALPQDSLKHGRFVVLLRDPRGVWASTKPQVTWAIHSIPLVCKLLVSQALSLPELVAGVGKHRVMVAVFEQWTMDTVAFSKDLSKLLGEPTNSFLAKAIKGQRPLKSLVPPKWVAKLSADEVLEVEGDPNCAVYMGRLGYKPNSTDLSGLKTSLQELAADLTQLEEKTLKALRAEQAALLNVAGAAKAQSDDDADDDDDVRLEFKSVAMK